MKTLYLRFLFLLHMPMFVFSQTNKLQSSLPSSQLQNFPLSSVRLLESPFKEAQETDLKYMLALDPDRLLAPFLREAGIEPKAKSYGNWEGSGLDGHIGGHYLSALSNMYASTGNKEVLQRLNYMIDQIDQCQQQSGDGYVGGIPGGKAMWKDVAQGKIDAGSFSLNGKWVPWYNIHKLYAGLVDAYVLAGNAKAKEVLIKLTDWCLNLTFQLSDEQIQKMLRSEHGGMNEVFADVASITGNKKYLELAERFSHRFILNPLIHHKDSLTGLHANTQIPKVIGYARIAEVGGDQQWRDAADFFWQTVVDHRSVSIGGNSVREHFHPANNFTSMVEDKEGPETCNTYNMLKLSKRLFLSNPSRRYMDYYERGLYNHILSSQHPKGGFVYFTPMRPRHYRVYSQPDMGFWCCVGSGLENHGKYGEMIYAHNDKDVFVNLFIPSPLVWKERSITITQQTKFPFEEKSTFQLKLQKPQKFGLHIRYPSWVRNGKMKVMVNGKDVKLTTDASYYVVINRVWKSGDVVALSLPMETSVEKLPDGSDWVSFVCGPIVLAAATDSTGLAGLRADDSRMGHIANGPLYPIEEAPLLVTSHKEIASDLKPVKGKPLTFTASSLIYPEKYKSLQLVPFYQVHDARYVIYWPITNAEGLEKRKQAIREAEEARLALEAKTVDQVAPGEQQPESDHNFQGEKTESGVNRDRHWRNASGWFSYNLKNKNKEGRVLRITYFGRDRNRTFDIYVNDQLLKTVNMDATHGDQFYDVDYEIPAPILNSLSNETMKVKFVAKPGSVAGGIYYVRLLK